MSVARHGILLCAGLGTRLRPLTSERPKPLLPFWDARIGEYGLSCLLRAGVEHVGANAHHLAPAVRSWFESRPLANRWPDKTPTYRVVYEENLRGTGGGARGVWSALGEPSGPVVVVNGDIVADFPIEALVSAHTSSGAVATMLTTPAIPSERPLLLEPGGQRIVSVPATNGEHVAPGVEAGPAVGFAGAYVVEADVFTTLPAGSSCLIRQGIGPLLARGELVVAFPHDGFWADLGTPRRFLDAAWKLLDDAGSRRRLSRLVGGGAWHDASHDFGGIDVQGPALVSAEATLVPGCTVGPYAMIGPGCTVLPGATIRHAVAADHATIDGNLERSIVIGDAVARARA